MLFRWVLLLISIGGILAETCSQRSLECQRDIPQNLPQNEEELESGCRILHDAVKCIVNISENCEEELLTESMKKFVEKKTEVLRGIEQFLFESCNPDSSIYKVISSNLECAYPVLTNINDACKLSELSESKRHVVDTYIELLRGREDDAFNLWGCAMAVWNNACAATMVSDKCGPEILLPGTEVLTSLDFQVQILCDQEIKDGIPKFVELLANAEEMGNELFKKK